MAEQALMKDQLGAEAVRDISQALSVCLTDFSPQLFIQQAMEGLEDKELKERVEHLILVLADYLPSDFVETANILLSIKDYWSELASTAVWGSFTAWPLIDYIASYGLKKPEISLPLLKALTPLFSAEFAIRPFIEQYSDLSYQAILEWTNDESEHVRRLASEGMRPRLPWGKRLQMFCIDPSPVLTVLENLKDDSSLYVRRSVANNINDISKDHPEKVIALCQAWSIDASVERQWIIRHALRSLVKAGNPDVFPLLGFSVIPDIQLRQYRLNKTHLVLGDSLKIETSIESKSEDRQELVIDYKIHHVKANGLTSSKVFKWKNISLSSHETVRLSKQHAFKVITTRKYYAGTHKIELLINGVAYASAEFELCLS